MAKLTNKEIDILVKKLTREVKEASLQKLEQNMKNDDDYQEVIDLHKAWVRVKENAEELRRKLNHKKDTFNANSGEDWKLDTDYDGNINWYYNGDKYYHALNSKIEQELVYQMIDKDNDMEAVTKAIVNKFSL